jgi:predicted ATPase/class 3 adenylate cyclase
MNALPTGTVTFLFTDLEGSTRLWEEHPESMQAALARHDEILRAAIDARGGHVVKMTGDGAHAVFASAHDAIAAAAAAQRSLVSESWDETGPLRVRMGVHTGHAEQREGDYFGPALNRAARLMSVAHGGQIVVSQAAADLARDAFGSDVALVDLGEHRLRDLSRPERVFQVNAAGLRREFAALASLDAFPGNLPLQVSSFVGRDRDLARVSDALNEARVVTLTGVGGVGKTRLALQVAGEVLPRFREGAWLCELAAVRDPEGVAAAVAAVFGVTARAGQGVPESLVEFFGTKQLLLILDNCEHLLEAVGDLVEVIEHSCAGVVVLATSREGLALDGERVVPVPSLAAPASDADLDAVAQAESARLFVERARGVDPDFALTAANAVAVAQVCRRLDGVPLAIELAAARVSAMNLAELARGLDRRFETLAGGRRRAVQRHQTLRAAIDWSYDLLEEPERRLLARLAVFAGGCTRDAAEAVCAGEPIERSRVFELLAGLVARSLVVAERGGPETRYRLLETIREYGEERLSEHDETDTLRRNHAEYYIDLADAVSQQTHGPQQIEAGRRLAAEHENLLAAMNYAIDIHDVDLALRLLRSMPVATLQIGYVTFLPVDPILELPDAPVHPLYALGLAAAAVQAENRGDLQAAETRCGQALEAAQRLGSDPEIRVEMMVGAARSAVSYSTGALLDAAAHVEHSVEIARAEGHPALANLLGAAAMYRTMGGDNDTAVRQATEGLALARERGAPTLIAVCLTALAGALTDIDHERASLLLGEALELEAQLDYEAWAELTQATLISARLQDWDQALDLAARSIRHLHWIGNRPLLAAMCNVAARALAPTNPEPAAVIQGAAHSFAFATGAPPVPTTEPSPPSQTRSARSQQSSGAPSFVTQLRRETTGLLQDALGPQRLHELRAQGQTMNTDDAVAYTLDAITRAQQPAATTNAAPTSA